MSTDDRARWAELLPTEPIRFGRDFVWGVASSAFQSEGGDVANDWVDAARSGRVPANPGNGFWERAEEDLRLVAALGIRHYRLSVEWSRVEPERGRFDPAAIDRYRAICDAARAAGITPWVNFFHFTHPRWFAARGGFLVPENAADFLRYLEHAGRALAPHARHFHVQNESMVYVVASYMTGQNPPFVRDRDATFAMTRTVLELHAEGYRILKSIDPGATVATIEVCLAPRPADPSDGGQRRFVARFDAWYHGVLLEALRTGWVRIADREPVEIPHLRGALDCYGFNYYTTTVLGQPAQKAPASAEGARSEVQSSGERVDRAQLGPGPAPIDSMGRPVVPGGMEEGILRVARALPEVPLLVTENGCPTTDETFRIRYLAAHLAALDRARRRGADVRGYFHWTAVDNYEWHHGFSDARFGLLGFDPATGARSVKRSGEWLRGVVAAGVLDPASIP